MKKDNIKKSMVIFLKGIAMGSADIIPGVSGGTIALITGIYSRLIKGINDAISEGLNCTKSFISGDLKSSNKSFKKIDFSFFIPLLLGIGIAFLALSKVIHYLLEEQTASTYAFFFGLILASVVFVIKQIKNKNLISYFILVLGGLFAYLFIGINSINSNHSLITIFFSGALAICAMILPGISGSFILVFLGQYKYMLSVLNNFMITEIITFISGAVIGLAGFSKLIDYLLKQHKDSTLSFVTGLMIGSLRLPYIEITSSTYSLIPVLLTGAIGAVLVLILEGMFYDA